MTRPTCITCEKPLAKYSRSIYFKDPESEYGATDAIPAIVNTKEEVQRHTNQEVISVKRSHKGTIWAAGVWDGTSYGDMGENMFCSGRCTQSFGRAMAKRMVADGRIKR